MIFRYFMSAPPLWLGEQADALDSRALGYERLYRPLAVVIARFVPVVLIQLLKRLQVLRVVHRLLEAVVEPLDDRGRHAFWAHEAVRRVRYGVHAELADRRHVPSRSLVAERRQQPHASLVHEARPAR